MGLIDLIDWARNRVQEKIDASAPGQAYWNAALLAIDACREKSGMIQEIGEERFRELLERIRILPDAQDSIDGYLEMIREMTAQEIIAEVGASADRVSADTAKREQREMDLLELLYSLGKIGAGLILTLIL